MRDQRKDPDLSPGSTQPSARSGRKKGLSPSDKLCRPIHSEDMNTNEIMRDQRKDPESKVKYRPRGKIVRLPPPLRKKLNELLDEGLTYAQVLAKLAPDAEHLTEVAISRWYHSAFQEWLKNQLWLEQTRSRLDMATDVIAEHEGSDVHQANLHIAADFFALRKHSVAQRWIFKETRNLQNLASHCDIAWAGALATEAHCARTATLTAPRMKVSVNFT